MWTLIICIGVTWAGCANVHYAEYPSEDSCYRALREMKTGDQQVAESGKKRNTVAYCKPGAAK
jgi:hypothetical protein